MSDLVRAIEVVRIEFDNSDPSDAVARERTTFDMR